MLYSVLLEGIRNPVVLEVAVTKVRLAAALIMLTVCELKFLRCFYSVQFVTSTLLGLKYQISYSHLSDNAKEVCLMWLLSWKLYQIYFCLKFI